MANTKTVFEQIKALTEKELAIFISDLIKTEDKPHGCKCPAGSFQYDPATKETRNSLFGYTELALSNGATVILKQTEIQANVSIAWGLA